MKAASILSVDFSDLQHGMEVILTETGKGRIEACGVMLRDVATLPACSARDALVRGLQRVQSGAEPHTLPLLFADLAVAFAGWSAGSYIDQKIHEAHQATGKKGGRPSDPEVHARRAALVEAAMQRNPALSKEAACLKVAKDEGVSVETIKKSVKKVSN